MDYDVFVRYIPLPWKTEAVVLPNDDDTYDIYINSKLCPESQRRAMQHEIAHIKKNHLYNEDPVVKNEKEAG